MTVRPVPVLGEDAGPCVRLRGSVRFGYRSTLGAGVAVARSTLHSAIVILKYQIVLPTGSHGIAARLYEPSGPRPERRLLVRTRRQVACASNPSCDIASNTVTGRIVPSGRGSEIASPEIASPGVRSTPTARVERTPLK